MKKIVTRLFLASSVLIVWSLTAVAQQASIEPRLHDSLITGQMVFSLADFDRAIQLSAAQAGIPQMAPRISQSFAGKKQLRVLPVAEWRLGLLEALYENEVPYPVALQFLASLDKNLQQSAPVDTGFLQQVRQVNLQDKVISKLSPDTGIRPPRAVLQPLPLYTDAARAARVEGTIHLRCVVLEDGSIANCTLVRPLGYGLDESTILMLQNRWKFEPALRDGKPVPVEAHIETNFRLY